MNGTPPNERQLTIRALATGALLGAVLVPCNVYSGLKIGWSFNMSIAAALLGAAIWSNLRALLGRNRIADWDLLENNVNQTSASAAASIISAGLVAPIPALTILTGVQLSWPVLSFWLCTVSLIGVLVALLLRRQMIDVQQLTFPSGVATAATIQEIHSDNRQGSRRTFYMLISGAIAAATKLFGGFVMQLPMIGPQMKLTAFGLPNLSTRSLGFAVEPSFLMLGFGAIIGMRVGASLLLGSFVAWGIIAPWLVQSGRISAPLDQDASLFAEAVEFLMWPGVALMVSAALVSFGLTIPTLFKSLFFQHNPALRSTDNVLSIEPDGVAWTILGPAIVAISGLAIFAQMYIFGIHPAMGLLAVLLTFVLAVVAARVSGETGIPPIGALGKVTQLTFGFIHPTSVTQNLMTANVTGGAAGQCSDLLHDLKAGKLIGASIRAQAAAQFIGVLVGSVAGSAAYLVLIPDPAKMLMTDQWPAPAVVTWRAVAVLFRDGLQSAPSHAVTASIIAAACGIVLAVIESRLNERHRKYWPSAVSIGLAFVIPAFNSISLFLGALLASLLARRYPAWSLRYTIAIAAGLVAGESLAGVFTAFVTLFSNG